MDENKRRIGKSSFGIICIVVGIILEILGIGREGFLGDTTVGAWLIYVGFLSIMIFMLQSLSNKKKKVDERMLYVASIAGRVTFVALTLFAFAVMIIDGIKEITIPYNMFMSYMICGMMVVYFLSYKLLLKYN